MVFLMMTNFNKVLKSITFKWIKIAIEHSIGVEINILALVNLRETHPLSKSLAFPVKPGRHLQTALWSSPKQSALGPHQEVEQGSETQRMHREWSQTKKLRMGIFTIHVYFTLVTIVQQYTFYTFNTLRLNLQLFSLIWNLNQYTRTHLKTMFLQIC